MCCPRHGERPKAVLIVAAFLFAATSVAAGVAWSLLFPNPLLDRLWEVNKQGAAAFHEMGRISGVALLLLGAGTFAAAAGLVQGKRWAWWFAMALFAINGMGDLVNLVITGDWVRSLSGVVVSAAFLYSVCGGSVRRYFGVA